MTTTYGPESMYSVKAGDETSEGPFYRQVQDAANRGAPYNIIGPDANGLYQQQIPPDIDAKSVWSQLEQWIVYETGADINFKLIYIQLSETEYTTVDVPDFMPNYQIEDPVGSGTFRNRKWFEWRSPNHYHWYAQSANQYAVPSTSWGFHVSCLTMFPLSPTYNPPGYAPLRTQKEWDQIAEGLPPGDVIPWPQT